VFVIDFVLVFVIGGRCPSVDGRRSDGSGPGIFIEVSVVAARSQGAASVGGGEGGECRGNLHVGGLHIEYIVIMFMGLCWE